MSDGDETIIDVNTMNGLMRKLPGPILMLLPHFTFTTVACLAGMCIGQGAYHMGAGYVASIIFSV